MMLDECKGKLVLRTSGIQRYDKANIINDNSWIGDIFYCREITPRAAYMEYRSGNMISVLQGKLIPFLMKDYNDDQWEEVPASVREFL